MPYGLWFPNYRPVNINDCKFCTKIKIIEIKSRFCTKIKNFVQISKLQTFLFKSKENPAYIEIYCPLNPFLMAMSFEKFCDKAHHNASLRFQATLSLT